MNHDEYLAYISEIKELDTLLSEIPPNNVIERMSLEARLKSAKTAIAGLVEAELTYKARLTFRGKPVFGSHGITADFGVKVAGAFSEAISAIAAGLSGNLQDMGPIPDKQKNQLLITGIAIGSFGFEFELPKPETETLHPDQMHVEKAIKIFQNLLQCAAEGSDDDITELLDEIQPRAIKRTAEFLSCLAQHDAWCALDFRNRSFHFQNLEQLEVSSNRLQENNIHERSENYMGEFQGVLPVSRTFEFRIADQEIVIKGRISQDIEDPDVLNRTYLHKPVKVEMNITQVGKGKPRHTLSSLDKIHISL